MAQEALDGTGPSQQNEKESYFGKSCDQIVGAIAKAYFQGQVGGSESRMMEEPDKQQSLFQASGALMPLYDPAGLAIVYENSSCLRSCVDAYVTNIDGFGHQFVPIIDLSHPTAFEAVRNALRLERKAIKKAALLSPEQTDVEKKAQKLPDEPSDADIKARMEELAVEIAQEKMELEVFFNNCTIDMPFAGPGGLRGHTRESLEIIGNAYWEVLRDGLGKVAQFNHIPSPSMRIAPTDDDTVEVEADVRVSPLAWKKLKVRKRFRRFIQCWLDNTKVVYFKEFGDPRCISADTGRVYRDFDELKEKEGKDRPVREATEVFWFKINSLRTAYGAPRWIGTLLAVLGNRQAEEMNFIYFENRSVPPLAVLVSGGRLNGDSVAKLEDHIRNNIKGARNSHKILLIEAEPASSMQQAAGSSGVPSRMKIELKPLTEAQLSDAQFLRYGEDNRDKIGQAFRLPRMLRGDVRDFNRSCYSEDTETLTESGWKTYDQIAEGEKIAAYNKDTGEVVFVVPEKKLVYDVVDETMWHLHNTKTDCLVTGDHRMLSKPVANPDSPWVESTAETLPFERFLVPVAATKWAGAHDIPGFDLPKSQSCRIRRGHSHDSSISFDDWLEFVGYFVAEGGLLMTDHPSAEYLVYIDQKKPEALAKMRACFDRIGWKYSTQIKPCGTTHMLFSNRCLREWIVRNLGTNSYNWKLPDSYLQLGERQLRILFEAMMLGDGTMDLRPGRSSGTYYSVSKRLADQAQEICLKLGLAAHVHFSAGDRYTGVDGGIWRCCFRESKTTTMAKTGSGRKNPATVSVEKYTGKVYCFSVPGYGYFVTRRRGKVAIQGNTSAASIDFAEVQVFSPIRQEFDWQINTRILPALGARYHLFRSNSPSVRDPQALAEMIERMVKSSVLTPEEGRSLCGDVFNQEFPVLGEKWTKQPIAMTLAGVHTEHGALVPAREDIKGASKEGLDSFNENGGMSAPGAGATQEALGVSKEDKVSLAALFKDVFAGEQRDDDEDEEEDEDDLEDEKAKLRKLRTRALLKLHKHFQEEERARAQAAYDKMEKIVVRLPEEEMRSLFLPEPQES
jgi:PBSX family phage portal protein